MPVNDLATERLDPAPGQLMSGVVRLEVADGIGVIRLERPPMNALNDEVQHGLIAAYNLLAGFPGEVLYAVKCNPGAE